MPKIQEFSLRLPDAAAGRRLDKVLAGELPDYSRERLKQLIRDGQVLVDGDRTRPRRIVLGGEWIHVRVVAQEATTWAAQAIALDIVFEDADLLVVNKPAGLVVHPGAGNPDGTLANALLDLDPAQSHLPRGGIVHRLDKDTSGLMVVARSQAAHTHLVRQLGDRSVTREYLAIIHGTPTAGGTLSGNIARHPRQRTKMAVVDGGRAAVTHYRIGERFLLHTLLKVRLETGRTHQIRVHMADAGYPLLGDPLYGGRPRIPKNAGETLTALLRGLRRQALHAVRLTLNHPASQKHMTWTAPVPEDLQQVTDALREHSAAASCGRTR